MKTKLFAALLALVWSGASAETMHVRLAPDDEGPLIAFIGEKIDISVFGPTLDELAAEKAADDAAKAKGSEIVRIPISTRYKARYRVVNVVAGEIKNSIIEFVTTNHIGEPPYGKQDPVLLFVRAGTGKWAGLYLHHRGPFAFVQQGTDGQWAACDDGNGLFYQRSAEITKTLHPVALPCGKGLTAGELAALVIDNEAPGNRRH